MVEDSSVLSLLETLSAASDLPQRSLAAQTGLNLAKVNFLLRKLVDKGYVKLKRVRDNPHKLRYLYLLTPEGLAEKSRLTYRFMKRVLEEYGQTERRIEACLRRMIAGGIRRVVLWGDNEITELCQRVMGALDGQVVLVGVVDPTGRRERALKPAQVAALDLDAVVLCEADGAPACELAGRIPEGLPVWRIA